MGLFKSMKDMKATVAAAPGMIDQAQQLAAQSQQLAANQQAAAAQQAAARRAAVVAEGPDFEPIAGVSLELYVEISKGLAAYDYDRSKGPDVAASKGVTEPDWNAAVEGWNARLRANPSVGQQFNALYTKV